jgi:thymidylate synthase
VQNYHQLLQQILTEGIASDDRTGTGTISIFGAKLEFDLNEGFPLLTTKKVSFKNVATELIWFLKGSTNVQYLRDNNNTIWDEWMVGDWLPETYPKHWRAFGIESVDQIAKVINSIKTNPQSRRHIVSAWDPATVDTAALPPCHLLFQFYVRDGALSCLYYMRSNDVFLGLPYNIASYALLTHIIAHLTGLKVGKLVYMGGDVHLYQNHIEQTMELLKRDYTKYKLPTITISSDLTDIDDIRYEHLTLNNYEHYPAIAAKVAV